MMPSQRACGAENQAGDTLSNGPLRARGKGERLSIPRRGARVSRRGYDGIPTRARVMP